MSINPIHYGILSTSTSAGSKTARFYAGPGYKMEFDLESFEDRANIFNALANDGWRFVHEQLVANGREYLFSNSEPFAVASVFDEAEEEAGPAPEFYFATFTDYGLHSVVPGTLDEVKKLEAEFKPTTTIYRAGIFNDKRSLFKAAFQEEIHDFSSWLGKLKYYADFFVGSETEYYIRFYTSARNKNTVFIHEFHIGEIGQNKELMDPDGNEVYTELKGISFDALRHALYTAAGEPEMLKENPDFDDYRFFFVHKNPVEWL